MTNAQRDALIARLEARVQAFEAFFRFLTNPHTGHAGVMTQSRLGIETEYWMLRPAGHGAALSVGTNTDRFAAYFEIDEDACPDAPSTAVYAAAVAQARYPDQPHIAVEAHAANAPAGNIPFHGDYQYAPHADFKTQGIRLREMNANGEVLKEIVISADGISVKDGLQGGGFAVRRFDRDGRLVQEIPLW